MRLLRCAAAAALCMWTVSACAAPSATRVWLIIDSDLGPEEIDEIEIEVDGRAIGALRETRRVVLSPEVTMPITLPITHAGGPLGPIEIRVRGRGRTDIEQHARFDFVPAREVELIMALERACVDVRCGRDETCREGSCAPRGSPLGVASAPLVGGPSDAGPEGFDHEANRLTDASSP